MPTPILATKLFVPIPRENIIGRSQLVTHMMAGITRKLTLVSAAAGYGKTTIVSSWAAACGRDVAWLSLDGAESDLNRFLAYLMAAVQTVVANLSEGLIAAVQLPQPPPATLLLTELINAMTQWAKPFLLVLDDYHLIDAPEVNGALTFLLAHLPPNVHLVIITREDPALPLARLRVQGAMSEIRAADLRFSVAESAEFFTTMGVQISADLVAMLETRTEGWAAGLQLAALSLQGRAEPSQQIAAFSGSHHFVLDYLLTEVLEQQSAAMQTFLLQTSLLDRLCGDLCDALLQTMGGQATLEQLEQTNLFIIPLDEERRWYRYHHLFADLLRQRLARSGADVATLHRRASAWFEQHGDEIAAFEQAVAAGDIDLAARLAEGNGMPLLFRGAVRPTLNWLNALEPSELDHRPTLWIIYASALVFAGRHAEVASVINSAENALQHTNTHDLIGHLATIRATLAVPMRDAETVFAQSQRALTHLHPDNFPVRTATFWTLGLAHLMRGEYANATALLHTAKRQAEGIGHYIINIASTIGLGSVLEAQGRWTQAAERFHEAIQLAGRPPAPLACEAFIGLARMHLAQSELVQAQQCATEAMRLAQEMKNLPTYAECGMVLARLSQLAGEDERAMGWLESAEIFATTHHFAHILPAIYQAKIDLLHECGDIVAATQLANRHKLPLPSVDSPLSAREIDVIRLVAQGLSNREIGERLFLALDTVKGHNRRIYAKLDVRRRTEAVARARELGLL